MGLDLETRTLVRVSAALGRGDRAALEEALDGALTGAAPQAVEEALLQSYLFLGYPAALNALRLWRRRAPAPAAPETEGRWDEWEARGQEVCARVYGGQYARLRENIRALHPDMERWMVAEGYGKVLGRPGLALRVRELCIAALLTGLDAEPQLYAHLRGAVNAGAAPGEVEEALLLALDGLEAGRAAAARGVWEKVRLRLEERGG